MHHHFTRWMAMMKTVLNYVVDFFAPNEVNKTLLSESRSINPPSSYVAFMGMCIDMNVRGGRMLYQDYLDAYHQNVRNGYDGLRAYEFLRMNQFVVL